MPKKSIELPENIEEKLTYIGLNLEKIPASIKKFEPLEFRVPKFYDEKQYRQYKYLPVKEIQILLSPTNRLDEIEEKYRKASPLADYLDSKNEKNILKYTTFLNMLKEVKIEDIQKIEEEQIKLNEQIPFKVKFEGNYLWQIYYSENTDKYFMIVPTEDADYSTFFYLLKKKLEKGRTSKIFVPIRNVGYSSQYLKKSEFEDIENYLWLFTKDWPLVYEVYDKNDKLSIDIIGETEVYGRIKSPYKIKLKNKEQASEFYKLVKAMFILQTELPHYFNFKTNIGKNGEIEFYIEGKKIQYRDIAEWMNQAYKKGKIRTQEVISLTETNEEKLNNLKTEVSMQEIEYLAKEKQISTFLECKKSFFGKFKYYFKYSKKKNKGKLEDKNKTIVEQDEDEKQINKKKKKKVEKEEKTNYTIEELLELYKELERLENILKNLVFDINSLKLKKKNMAKKIENATSYIEEIDSHKKSIFEFWRYSNKDEMSALPEGEEEEVANLTKVTKIFDYEEDLEKFGKMMDKIQRRNLSKQDTDSLYIASTNLIDIINQLKQNEASPKDIEASLKELKKEAIQEKTLTENDEFDIFGGITQDMSKTSQINNQKHREIAKDKFSILDITKNTKPLGYKLALENVIENVKNALEKVTLSEDLPIYKAISGKSINEKDINLFNINPEKEIKEAINQKSNEINFYKINLKKGNNAISYTNNIFYDNQNKTLPIGQDLSTKILVDMTKLFLTLKENTSFKIVEFENEKDDFSKIVIKTINVFEYDT